jgi:hypothetical protein
MIKDMEISARRLGVTDRDISRYDINGFSGITHFVESVMLKFDSSHLDPLQKKGFINRRETLRAIYPVFKSELQSMINLPVNLDAVYQAILLYVMQKGRMPVPCMTKIDWWTLAYEVVDWIVSGGITRDFQADRAQIYAVFSALSSPPSASCPSTPPQACTRPAPPTGAAVDAINYLIRFIPPIRD